MSETREALFAEVRACRVCEAVLPLGPRPVLRGLTSARIAIVSQAPGTRVHETGLSFNDRSGDRLRDWLAIDRETFYDERRIAILPIGFCYPGVLKNGGDAPPRPECAPLWQARVLGVLPEIRLILLVGSHAIRWHLRERARATMTETVRDWRAYLPRHFPLPHPSWRTTGWQKRAPWFDAETLPDLRRRVARLLKD